jgi:phosphonoacetaldehyde hydrolase
MEKCDLVVFDWAGTTVDYGSFAPVKAFEEIFLEKGIQPTMDEIRKPMGMLKRDHIKTMLEMPRISKLWVEIHGGESSSEDIDELYSTYEGKLLAILHEFANPKPFLKECVSKLRKMDINIGSTTGYNDRMMGIVVPAAKKNGYSPDFWITPDSTGGTGRPYPFMIFENMKHFKVESVERVVKVGDTISDIREGKNAGVFTVGIVEGSSLIGLTEHEYETMDVHDREAAIAKAKRNYLEAGADAVIMNLSELPGLIG